MSSSHRRLQHNSVRVLLFVIAGAMVVYLWGDANYYNGKNIPTVGVQVKIKNENTKVDMITTERSDCSESDDTKDTTAAAAYDDDDNNNNNNEDDDEQVDDDETIDDDEDIDIDEMVDCSEVCRQAKAVATAASATSEEESSSTNSNDNTIDVSPLELLDAKQMLSLATNAKSKLLDNLKVDYGEYFDDIFLPETNSLLGVLDGNTKETTFAIQEHQYNHSMVQLKRKLMIKVLTVQKTIMQQQNQQKKNINGASTCTCDSINDSVSAEQEQSRRFYTRYVWATGGHSAAAGHGNLYNETFTAYLGRDAKMVFEAIGIEFDARNYAMGGTSSGYEVSMCWQEIFGSDVDFFTWDYGMTDGYGLQLFHYGYKGATSPGKPVMLALDVGTLRERYLRLHDLQKMGIPIFLASDAADTARMRAIPDSADGLTMEQIQAMPEYVRNFKCGEQMEHGDPFCSDEKFTKYGCSPRSGQVSWHPGFKSQAAKGHAISLFLVNILLEVLEDLASREVYDPISLLAQLEKEDDEDYQSMLQKELPSYAFEMTGREWSLDKTKSFVPSNILKTIWQGSSTTSSICRTGRLPAQSRFFGQTTNSNRVGGIAQLGTELYDVGVSMTVSKNMVRESGPMELTYDPNELDREECNALVSPDHKDFFYAHHNHGISILKFPNEKEKMAHNYDPSNFRGMIVLVFGDCPWEDCEEGELRDKDLSQPDTFRISINNISVDSLTPLNFKAFLVKSEQVEYFFPPDEKGEYEIQVQVDKEDAYVRFSSIILF